MSMGCSKRTGQQSLGCHPKNRNCDVRTEIIRQVSDNLDSNLGGIQLTTSALAKSCYCHTNGCNDGSSDHFKIAMSGYIAILMGSFGIVGNLVAIAILTRPDMKSSTNYILIGKMTTLKTVLGRPRRVGTNELKPDSSDGKLGVHFLSSLTKTNTPCECGIESAELKRKVQAYLTPCYLYVCT